MARPNQEAIETFMNIAGVTEAIAVQKLEEHHGDLNEAVNAYFSERDRNISHEAPMAAPHDDMMDIDDPLESEAREFSRSIFSTTRATNPFSILDPSFGTNIFDRSRRPGRFHPSAPFVTHPREVRQIPIDFHDANEPSHRSPHAPTIEDVTGTTRALGQETHGPVIIDDDVDEDVMAAPTVESRLGFEQERNVSRVNSRDRHGRQIPTYDTVPDSSNDIEEEMIRAAIEASKQEAGHSSSLGLGHTQFSSEDTELAHAVSESLKAAEEKGALFDQKWNVGESRTGASGSADVDLQRLNAPNGRLEKGSSSLQDEAEEEEVQPLVGHRSRRMGSRSTELPAENVDIDGGQPLTTGTLNAGSDPPSNGNAFPSEWGGISSEEHDEAVMLEAAMFGGIPEGGYRFGYPSNEFAGVPNEYAGIPSEFAGVEGPYSRRMPRPPSPSLEAQRLIREQQDDEYLQALQADRDKEMKALRDAEARRLEEVELKRAAAVEEKLREEEAQRKMQEEKELERHLVQKEASLPQEPAADEENAVTLLVRMPDGNRHGRRFRKSDKLQSLFDFIDIGRGVKPGSYRLVRPFPRRTFSEGESSLTLNELGLTSKQEALFLELINA